MLRKPEKMSENQYCNYLAIQLLEEMGNDCPTQEAIDFVETAVKRFTKKNIFYRQVDSLTKKVGVNPSMELSNNLAVSSFIIASNIGVFTCRDKLLEEST